MTTSHTPACRETLQQISAYLDGELDASTCEAIEQHSHTCPGCAALVDGLRNTVGLCRQAAHVDLPDAVRERAKSAVNQLLDSTHSRVEPHENTSSRPH